MAFVVGGAIGAPLQRHDDGWLVVATLGELIPGQPTPVMLRVTRDDGCTQVIDRQVVFLVKTGETQVTALSSTCTHLGCRVSWDAEGEGRRCPCHGGTYDRMGAVLSGTSRTAADPADTRRR